MRVIDLLNKIANGEEVPKKIKYQGVVFTLEEETYYAPNTMYILKDYIKLEELELNDEVEVIEEDNKIEKLGRFEFSIEYSASQVANNYLIQGKKINEIIDELNKLKEK